MLEVARPVGSSATVVVGAASEPERSEGEASVRCDRVGRRVGPGVVLLVYGPRRAPR